MTRPYVRGEDGALPERCGIAIIGAGVMGLSIAYQLTKRGYRDVVILDEGYLAEGASGRNGGGVRMQWSTEANIRLMQDSIELCRSFASELGVQIWLRQGGYLFLARTPRAQAALETNAALQNKCGVPTRMITPSEIQERVPVLDTTGVLAAAFNPKDGVVFPWPFLWGYAERARAEGARLFLRTRCTAIEPVGRGYAITTPRGTLTAERVVCAAGAWSPEVARQVGLVLPTQPHRHEILSTEALRPFLDPMVAELESGLYFSQSMRGEIVCGISVPDDDDGRVKLGSRLEFLLRLAPALVGLVPRLASVKILRQWAGPYDVSPDGRPLLGAPHAFPGFYLCSGFVGHGFMMAPVIGRIYADYLVNGVEHPIFATSRIERFERGELEHESMILG